MFYIEEEEEKSEKDHKFNQVIHIKTNKKINKNKK